MHILLLALGACTPADDDTTTKPHDVDTATDGDTDTDTDTDSDTDADSDTDSDSDTDTDTDTDTGGPPAQGVHVGGWGTDVLVHPEGDSQGEPSVGTASDGSLVTAWMQDEGSSIYVKYSRSTDGGQTWGAPAYIDKDQWGWQNDPVVIAAGDRLYFTWLALESTDASVGNIYCVDSTDGGRTWSDKVKLSADGDNDREWLATDPSGRAVITWTSVNARDMQLEYAETPGGCANFSAPVVAAHGTFLNGVPAIAADGSVWLSRDKYETQGSIVLTKQVDGTWTDTTLYSFQMPTGVPRPARPVSFGKRRALALARGFGDPDRDAANGHYDGETSPIAYVQPDGRVVVTALVTEAGSNDGDVYFFSYDGTNTTTKIVNADGGGAPQFEPWMIQDDGGNLHLVWYDGREDYWRLYGASSYDGGETFGEYTIGDSTFQNGFDEVNRYYKAWVGHFQGMTLLGDSVVTVFGDSRDNDVSWIYADVSTP